MDSLLKEYQVEYPIFSRLHSWSYCCPTVRAFSSILLCAIIPHNHPPFFKIFPKFVHFCPNFPIFCPFFPFLNIFLPFLQKITCMPLLSRIDPEYVLMTFLKLSVILLSMTIILPSTLYVIMQLICDTQNCPLNLNLTYEMLRTGAGSRLLI